MARRRLISAEQVAGWEDEMRAAFAEAAAAQRRTVGKALEQQGMTWESPSRDTAGDLWSQNDWHRALEDHLLPASTRIARQIVSALRRAVPGRHSWGMPDSIDQIAGRAVDRALAGGSLFAARLTRSPITAAGVDIDAVAQAVVDAPSRYGGVVHPDSRATVADAYQAAHDQLAELVARVTSQMSNEAVTILSSTAEDATGAHVQHVWSAVGDDATRPDHADADGQVQDAGDPFDVGGEDLMYPGDPDGSDSNTCNCRCWLEIIGLDAAS